MINVLVVDDSAMTRKMLSQELALDPEINIIGTAPDPYIARDKIVKLNPDVLTLDIEMPGMDGISFLKKVMHYRPMPVIIISSMAADGMGTALKAFEAGAFDFARKPDMTAPGGPDYSGIIEKIKAANSANMKAFNRRDKKDRMPAAAPSAAVKKKIVAIGASTGGTEAIRQILQSLPENAPGTVIVQHMPENFTKYFADDLNGTCAIEVKEAEDGDRVTQGRAIIARGNSHMLLRKQGDVYSVEVKDGPKIHNQRPSVDLLFNSAARYAGCNGVGVLLTGMGSDGAKGLLEMKKSGAMTAAQDRASCVVYGMPKAAVDMGAAMYVKDISEMAEWIMNASAGETAEKMEALK